MMRAQTVNLALLFLILTTACSSHPATIQLPRSGGENADSDPYGDDGIYYFDCLSWRVAVEAGNIIEFTTIPMNCEDYVEGYMLHPQHETLTAQYQNDSKTVCEEAYEYVIHYVPKNDTKNIFIFDIDETLLSNAPFYKSHDWGAVKIDPKEFKEWLDRGICPALPATLDLYHKISTETKVKPLILTERSNLTEATTLANLVNAGISEWEDIIFRPSNDTRPPWVFKASERQKLVDDGYTIVGSIGDLWTDFEGGNAGFRTFKLPNPMYYYFAG